MATKINHSLQFWEDIIETCSKPEILHHSQKVCVNFFNGGLFKKLDCDYCREWVPIALKRQPSTFNKLYNL